MPHDEPHPWPPAPGRTPDQEPGVTRARIDPPLWFARLLARLVELQRAGVDQAEGYSRLLELGQVRSTPDGDWLLLPTTGDGYDRTGLTAPNLIHWMVPAPDGTPVPQVGAYLAGQLTQAREAMGLALSVLRGDAYRRQHGVADPAALDISQARGEAIDALGLALGHTQLVVRPDSRTATDGTAPVVSRPSSRLEAVQADQVTPLLHAALEDLTNALAEDVMIGEVADAFERAVNLLQRLDLIPLVQAWRSGADLTREVADHGARLEVLEAKVYALRNPDDAPPF